MNIDDNFLSHPHKRYNDHIKHIADSFSENAHTTVAKYHDLGKLSDAFQTYISLQKKQDETVEEFERRRNKFKTTHTLESAYLYFCNTDSKDSDFLANFFAILKHHSCLKDIKKEINEYLSVIDNKGLDEKRLKKIETIADKAHINFKEDVYEFIDFFDELTDEDFYQTTENFFLFKKRYSRLILADKFEAIFSKSYETLPFFSQEQLQKHIGAIYSIIEEKQKVSPNAFRTKARETVFKNFDNAADETNIYLIKAPTGVGKTYIALELALKIALKTADKRRIITTIPFTSIIDQTHSEYEKILQDEKVLKYHHLTKYQEDDDEGEQFSQKVFLADIWHEHFIVTTFNQLLNTFLSNHNKDNLRLETLRDSVIIVDEVQNIPRALLKNISYVFDMFAKRYNIHFIIMSATMPHLYDFFEKSELLSEDFFYTDTKKKSRYRLVYQKGLGSYESLKDAILQHNSSVLCVVNTIEKAKNLHKTVNAKNCYLLTTHQTPQHRKEIIEEIKEKLNNDEKIILVATQLIEAGVDLDFDVGYREFAPFGSIIQMAGRVNREGQKGICEVFVFDYIEGKNAPYHAIDLQETKIKELLQKPVEENKLLDKMDSYFIDLKDQTSSVNLMQHMKNLEFETLFNKFNENFMPHQPWKVSLFVEQEEGHFQAFLETREEKLKNAKSSFAARDKIKDLEKDLGLYTISVSQNLIDELIARKHTVKEMFGRYILPYGSEYYTREKGFNLELTTIEEAFS